MNISFIAFICVFIVYIAFAIFLSIKDIKTRKIEKKYLLAFLPLAIAMNITLSLNLIVSQNMTIKNIIVNSLVSAILMFCCSFLFTYLHLGYMGGSDIWLLTMTSFALVNVIYAVMSFIFSEIIFAVVAACIMIVRKIKNNKQQSLKKEKNPVMLPFFPFIFISNIIFIGLTMIMYFL